MKIELTPSRMPIIAVHLIPTVGIGVMALVMSILYGINLENARAEIPIQIIIIFWAVTAVFVLVALLLRFVKSGHRFVFDENEISIFNRGELIDKVRVEDIEEIYFHPFRLRYIVTIFMGELNDGGCWKLHLKMRNGEKKELYILLLKDIKLLKEKLYKDLDIR